MLLSFWKMRSQWDRMCVMLSMYIRSVYVIHRLLLASSSLSVSFSFKLHRNTLRKCLLTYLWFFSSFHFSRSHSRALLLSLSLSLALFERSAFISAFDFMVLTWTRCFVKLALLDHKEGYHYRLHLSSVCCKTWIYLN